MATFPFDANHAVKANVRGDLFDFQFVAERMRAAIFTAAASRQGAVVRGSKRASRYLDPSEREIILRSYGDFGRQTIRELSEFYLSLLTQVRQEYGTEAEIVRLRQALHAVAAPEPAPRPLGDLTLFSPTGGCLWRSLSARWS